MRMLRPGGSTETEQLPHMNTNQRAQSAPEANQPCGRSLRTRCPIPSSALAASVLALCSFTVTHAATYYVDPAAANMSNAGSSTAPWSTLEAVFTANKTFAGGDV